MNIGFIRKEYSPYGGAERFLAKLIDSIASQGHKVHIFAHSWQTEHLSKDISFHKVPVIKGASFIKTLSFAFFVKRMVRSEDIDIIFSLERTLCHDIYRAGDGCHRQWLLEKAKACTLLERFADLFNMLNFAILYIEKRIFKQGNYEIIIANSERGRQEINKIYGIPEKDIYVVYNGVDITKYHPENRKKYFKSSRLRLGISENDIVILFIGSGFRRKGLSVLIKAAGILLHEPCMNIRLLIAGRGSDKRYKNMTKTLGIGDSVIFLGPADSAEELYSASDIFILPTLYEPFSNACIEAMASGLPVITTRINGVSEIIEEGKNGLIQEDPLCAYELAGLIKMLKEPLRRTEMGMNARRTAEQYTVEKQNGKIIEIIDRIYIDKSHTSFGPGIS